MISGPKPKVSPTTAGGAQLLAYMVAKRWSQRETANLLGWKPDRLNRLLSGNAVITALEAFAAQDMTDGDVPARAWTVDLQAKKAAQKKRA